jgi:hypothetical protein
LTYIFFIEGLFKSGNVPERVLFPRNLNLLQFMTKMNRSAQDILYTGNNRHRQFLTRIQGFPDSGWTEEFDL